MVKVYPTLHAVVGDSLAAHLHSLLKTHVVDGTAGELEKNRRLHPGSGLHHACKCFEIIEIGCEDSRLVCLALVKKFLNVHDLQC